MSKINILVKKYEKIILPNILFLTEIIAVIMIGCIIIYVPSVLENIPKEPALIGALISAGISALTGINIFIFQTLFSALEDIKKDKRIMEYLNVILNKTIDVCEHSVLKRYTTEEYICLGDRFKTVEINFDYEYLRNNLNISHVVLYNLEFLSKEVNDLVKIYNNSIMQDDKNQIGANFMDLYPAMVYLYVYCCILLDNHFEENHKDNRWKIINWLDEKNRSFHNLQEDFNMLRTKLYDIDFFNKRAAEQFGSMYNLKIFKINDKKIEIYFGSGIEDKRMYILNKSDKKVIEQNNITANDLLSLKLHEKKKIKNCCVEYKEDKNRNPLFKTMPEVSC
jgi:hypothetical protein